jgi:hypothetical protein
MSGPFPPSPTPFGSDPFGAGPVGSDPFATEPRNRGPLIAALALVLLIGLGAVAFLLLVRGSSSDDVEPGPASPPPAAEMPPATEAPPVTEPAATDPPATEPSETSPPIPATYLSGPAALSAMEAVAAEVGGDPFQAIEVVLYPEYVITQVQDPTEPTFIDRVVWRNQSVASRDPVQVPSTTDLAALRFTLADVNWDAIDGLVEAALVQTEVVDGQVSHIIIQRPLPFAADVRFRVFVVGPRTSGYLDAAADGNILAVSTG